MRVFVALDSDALESRIRDCSITSPSQFVSETGCVKPGPGTAYPRNRRSRRSSRGKAGAVAGMANRCSVYQRVVRVLAGIDGPCVPGLRALLRIQRMQAEIEILARLGPRRMTAPYARNRAWS